MDKIFLVKCNRCEKITPAFALVRGVTTVTNESTLQHIIIRGEECVEFLCEDCMLEPLRTIEVHKREADG